MPQRSLIVDRTGVSGPDRARSRSEALRLLTDNEYDLIELRTKRPGVDEYGLVEYLSGTWPLVLQHITVRTATPRRPSAEWNREAGKFVVIATPPARRRQRLRQPQPSAFASAESR
jgi:hypothetical protein